VERSIIERVGESSVRRRGWKSRDYVDIGREEWVKVEVSVRIA